MTNGTEVIERPAYTQAEVQLIKDTVARGATDGELKLFMHVCQKTGLDPFMRQIHMIKRWDAKLQREVATMQTGIDGYRVIAERSGGYAGQDQPIFQFPKGSENGIPVSATVTVYRFMGEQRVGFTATAFYDEYVQLKKDGNPNSFWTKMPKSQLAKCAEALALRKAFPNDLSGIYTHDEMAQADNAGPTTPALPPGSNPAAAHPPVGGNPEPLRTMPSKYGSDDKPSKCNFCSKSHVKEGDSVVQHPTMKKGDKNVWGAASCYAGTFKNGDKQPPKEEAAAPESKTDPARQDILDSIPGLEIEVMKKEKTFKVLDARTAACGSPVLNDASDDSLVAYMGKLQEKLAGTPG